MSYFNYSKKLRDDINIRKEFAIYNIDHNKSKNPTELDNIIKSEKKLILNSYQSFIKEYINPNTKYDRLLLIHSVGTGKTISALSAATSFIKINPTSSVIIIGFTKHIFKNELLNHPDFGFISKNELDEFKKAAILSNSGNISDVKYYTDLKMKYNRRLSNRDNGGNFKFYGYKELMNKLLDTTKLNKENKSITNMNNDDIKKNINNGLIMINKDFLKIFKNSLIICDEIHNVYNSFTQNNWGLAIELILDYYSHEKLIRAIFLSATPLNNNPKEIVSIINLLSNIKDKIKVNMLFDSHNNLLNNIVDIINNKINGKISYLLDSNPQLYPSKSFVGNSIKHINFLKFIRCPMSKLHFNTYKYLSNHQNIDDFQHNIEFNSNSSELDESYQIVKDMKKYPVNLALDNRYLNDFVLPNPSNENLGIYLAIDIKNKLKNADNKWKEKHSIEILEDNLHRYIITGNILLQKNIIKYSTKYYKLLLDLKDIILNKHGKIFIYHHFVSNSGILFIQELLKINGYLDEFSAPISNSICNICTKTLAEHNKIKHDFIPIRFILVTGDFSKASIYKSLDKYNAISNNDGNEIRILLGSKAIKESYDLKAIQHIMITHSPDNISELIQIIGRAVRKNSHINLPVQQRHTNISIYVSSISDDKINTFEETRYKKKMITHNEIHQIENILFQNSIDYYINYNINNTGVNQLIGSPFQMNKNINISKINLNTFETYHLDNEINNVRYIIKRLFIEVSNVFTYNDLYDSVQNPPFNIEFNTKLISENSFILALYGLVYEKDNIHYENNNNIDNYQLVNKLFDPIDKIIIDLEYNKNVIININKYFLLTNFDNINTNINIDSYFRSNISIPAKTIDLDVYVNKYKDQLYDYDYIYKQFIKITDFDQSLLAYSFDFHLEIIKKIISELYHKTKIADKDFKLKLVEFYKSKHLLIYINDTNIKNMYKNNYIYPIGHMFKNIPEIYNPKTNTWSIENNILLPKNTNYTENELIGFDSKESNSLIIKFKLRTAISNKEIIDKRKIVDGINCLSKDKIELVEILKKLKITIPDKKSKINYCNLIRNKLIELQEKNNKIKYFYYFYE